ncbi:MAG: pre-peptidase C-terminal domain-containing protein, partial [Verrucomicrobiota bacterium]|nr:pre-peptidase C-terminal domain-containing protein [Verrucomicrobiota bacterium]
MNVIKIAALCLLASLLTATAGSPRVTQVYPAGGQRGTEIEITCSGSNLEDARNLLFSDPRFGVWPVKAEKTKFTVKVKIAPDIELGEHSFRVITQSGVADLRLFYVSPFPLVEEQAEDKVDPYKPQAIALGTTVYGRTQNEDQDHFAVELKKGERLSAEVIGARLQTQSIYDSQLIIAKPDGTPLADVDDTAFSRQDPVVSVVAPEDGKYLVIIKDSTNAGTGACHYLLNIGSFPRPVAVFPPGGRVAGELKVKLIGDALGVLERTVQLPAEPHERFPLFVEDTQTAPQPHYLRVSRFANVLEAEPNNEVASATATDSLLPIAFNGIIEQKGDVDFFKFAAKKGQDYDVSVFARRLRSPLDSVLDIHDAKGARINGNDDSGGMDSYVRWKAPADGPFFVAVRDQLSRGGEAFTYRIEIKPVEPKITVWLPPMVINSSQERRAIVVPKGNRYASLVRVKRWDVSGTIALETGELPPGVKAHMPAIDKTVDTVPVVFEAAADAAPSEKAVTMQAKLNEPPPGVTVASAVEHDVDISENGNQR